MNITICGSVYFMDEMKSLKKQLRKMGFENIYIPFGVGGKKFKDNLSPYEDGQRKIKLDLINKHWQKILKSDCILVANYDKNQTPGYIGGNTFLEMGYAFVTGKPIFLLNPIPKMSYTPELEGMKPIIISHDLKEILNYYKH